MTFVYTSRRLIHHFRIRSRLLIAVTSGLIASVLPAQEIGLAATPDPRRGAEYFESRVRPLLVTHCYACHSDAKAKPSAGLRLDTPDGWLGGHDLGAAVKPGFPEESPLVRAVRFSDPELQMPPVGKLSAEEIATLEHWVAMGAPGPAALDAPASGASPPTESRQAKPSRAEEIRVASAAHRLFGPIRSTAPPVVEDASWPRTDLDRFVRQTLANRGLKPSPAADRRTWIRRVTVDLTGLPATPEEVSAFLADPAEEAFSRVVDRLLASPRFGERWGRKWLDVARYSDSNGQDENLALANAWRYRDWVVRALNADLPYDRFVTWQLAGDLVPEPPANDEERFDRTTATGFLVFGPKMLAEQDKPKLVFDTVDEQMDVSARAFMGLTVGCARCHDHKFDPISQRDYFALAGVFKSTKTFANLDFVSRWNERELGRPEDFALRDAHRKLVSEAEAAIKLAEENGRDAATNARLDGLARHLAAAGSARPAVLVLEAENASRGNLATDATQWGDADVVIARTGSAERPNFAEYDVTSAVAAPRRLFARYASAERRPVRLSLNGELLKKDALAEETGGFHPVHQVWTDLGSLALKAGRNVLRIETKEHFPHVDRFAVVDEATFASAVPVGLDATFVRELAVLLAAGEASDDPVWRPWRIAVGRTESRPAAAGAATGGAKSAVTASPSALDRAFAAEPQPTTAADAAARYAAVFAVVADAWKAAPEKNGRKKLDDPGLDLLARTLFGGAGLVGPRGRVPESAWTADLREAVARARKAVEDVGKSAPPPIARCLAVEEGKPEDVALHVRGSHLNPAPDTVPRGFLAHFAETVPFPAIPDGGSGRLAFAQWLTDARHPLTARVAVNRIWQGHFGRGLIASASNFGLRGEGAAAAEHEDLLDHLARSFVASGWSMKTLHRTIVLSSTYRMSSASDPVAVERDPEGRLLWRFPRLRLDAEAIRDGILAISGRLDLRLGGPPFEVGNGDYVTNDQSADVGRYGSRRRALYLPIVRNALYDFFASFDFGDPSVTQERRIPTVVPAQALWLRNSPFVREEAAALAARIDSAGPADDATFAGRVYEAMFARKPTEKETARAAAFLRGDAARRDEFCRAVFASDEFLYVD